MSILVPTESLILSTMLNAKTDTYSKYKARDVLDNYVYEKHNELNSARALSTIFHQASDSDMEIIRVLHNNHYLHSVDSSGNIPNITWKIHRNYDNRMDHYYHARPLYVKWKLASDTVLELFDNAHEKLVIGIMKNNFSVDIDSITVNYVYYKTGSSPVALSYVL